MNNTDKQTSSLNRLLDKFHAFGNKVFLYVTLPLFFVSLLYSKKWDESYLFVCPFIAFGFAYAYRTSGGADVEINKVWQILKAYVLVLPGVYLVLVLLGFVIFGINQKSDIYQITFALASVSALIIAVSGITGLIKSGKPKNCLKCEAQARFFIESADDNSQHTDRYCYKHFNMALYDVLLKCKGNFLITAPVTNYSNNKYVYTFHTVDDLAFWEYSVQDIERVKTLLRLSLEKTDDNGMKETLFTIIEKGKPPALPVGLPEFDICWSRPSCCLL